MRAAPACARSQGRRGPRTPLELSTVGAGGLVRPGTPIRPPKTLWASGMPPRKISCRHLDRSGFGHQRVAIRTGMRLRAVFAFASLADKDNPREDDTMKRALVTCAALLLVGFAAFNAAQHAAGQT